MADYTLVNVSELTVNQALRGVLPPLCEKTKADLKESIFKIGITDPICICNLGGKTTIFDGYERIDIAKELGIKKVATFVFNFDSLLDAMISRARRDFARRHLNNYRKCLSVEPIYEQLKVKGKMNKQAGGRGQVLENSDKVNAGVEAALLAGVSKDTFLKALKIKKGLEKAKAGKCKKITAKRAALLLEKLESGSISIHGAYCEYDRSISKSVTNYDLSIKYINNRKIIDSIYCGDIEKGLKRLPDGRVTGFIYSPPYYGVKEGYGSTNYDYDMTYPKYEEWMKRCFIIMAQKLRDGGFMAVNIDHITNGDKEEENQPYRHNSTKDFCNWIDDVNDSDSCNLKLHTEIIWDKTDYAKGKNGRGCPGSLSFPPAFEKILVFRKNSFKMKPVEGEAFDLENDELRGWTNGIWKISPGAKADDNPHPYVFPKEIPHRLIKLLSAPGDLICDPFCGSGTTLFEAKLLNRHFHGIDANDEFCQYADDRLAGRKGTGDEKKAIKRCNDKMN